MKTKRFLILFIPVFICALSAFILNTGLLAVRENVVSSCKSDMNKDGIEEDICITGEKGTVYGKDLVIRTEGKELGRYNLEALKPWKVQVADVDGDGGNEISVGVYKTTQFHPVMTKRPFLYNWKDGVLSAKWLGSRLSRPFEDYIFCDIDEDGMDELISTELLSNGRMVINSYKWKGFGFEGMAESRDFQEIAKLKKYELEKKGVYTVSVDVIEDGDWEHAVFYYQDGRMIEQEKN